MNDTPLIVVVTMGDPVEEMGPAPPSAASQIMISNSFELVAVELVKISHDTSATIEVPVYPHFHTAGIEEMDDTSTPVEVRATFA